jgi:hypothetical protein
MYIGKHLLIKYEGKVQEGTVIQIFSEDLDIQLTDNLIVRRKFWEVRSIINEKEKTENN